MLRLVSIFLIWWMSNLCAVAANEVKSLPSLPVDSITEKGVVVSFNTLSNTGGECLSFWLDLRAFCLDHDFVISGAQYYRDFNKISTPTINPFTLTI
ncbi:MAG: hypothetical protein K2K94_05715, partial [Muribaculaceae bacterium]|nr:hypothetical protein [Muribaculaceae bacterium]